MDTLFGFVDRIDTRKKGCEMKGYTGLALAIAVVLFGVVGQVSGECPKHTYFLTEGYSFSEGNMIFNYLDMDAEKPKVQTEVVVMPGEDVTAAVSWTWGRPCPDCIVSIGAWGSWSDQEIARLYMGQKARSTIAPTIPVSFPAPDSPGEYEFRVIFAYDGNFKGSFDASAPCSPEECDKRGECYVLIAEGRLNVTRHLMEGQPPRVRITSPTTTKVSGVVELNRSAVVTINALVDDPDTNISILVDGVKVGEGIPFSWNTINHSTGLHEIVVEAKNQKGSIGSDAVDILLLNRSTPHGTPPGLAWSLTFGSELRSFDISPTGNTVVSAGERLMGFDRLGGQKWTLESPFGTGDIAVSEGGEFILSSGGERLYVLDGKGAMIWNATIGSPADDIAISGSGQAAARSGNNIYLLSNNGTILWTTTITGLEGLSILESGLVVTNSKNDIYLLDNGSILWTYPTTGIKGISSLGEEIFAYSENTVFFLNRSGGLLGSFKAGSIRDMAVSRDAILLLTNNSIESYSTTGNLQWRYPVHGADGIATSSGFTVYSKDNGVYLLSFLPPEKMGRFSGMPSWILALGAGAGILILLFIVRRRRKSATRDAEGFQRDFRPRQREGKIEAPQAMAKESRVIVRVKNAKNRKHVAGARVSLGSETRNTDERGEVIFTQVPPGGFTLKLEAPSYKTKELKGTLRWEEEYIDAELEPELGAPEFDLHPRIQNIIEVLDRNFEKVSGYDKCIPTYLREVALGFVNIIREIAYSPELFKDRDAQGALHEAEEVVDSICTEIGRVMTDWKNVRLYQASMELEEPESICKPGKISMSGIRELFSDPEGYTAGNISAVEMRVSQLDFLINSKMKELTVLPPANMWKIASSLLKKTQEGGIKGAFSLFAADALCTQVEGMLENEEIVRRLSFSLF
jgi:hypothetical protein